MNDDIRERFRRVLCGLGLLWEYREDAGGRYRECPVCGRVQVWDEADVSGWTSGGAWADEDDAGDASEPIA